MKDKEKKEEKSLKPVTWTVLISLFLILMVIIIGFFIYKNLEKSSSKDVKNIINELKVYNVEINKIGFVPTIINIKEGDSVIWTNKEQGYFHKVVSINSTEIISEKLLTGQNFTHVFFKKGVYEYNCLYHPYTKGKIIVE